MVQRYSNIHTSQTVADISVLSLVRLDGTWHANIFPARTLSLMKSFASELFHFINAVGKARETL